MISHSSYVGILNSSKRILNPENAVFQPSSTQHLIPAYLPSMNSSSRSSNPDPVPWSLSSFPAEARELSQTYSATRLWNGEYAHKMAHSTLGSPLRTVLYASCASLGIEIDIVGVDGANKEIWIQQPAVICTVEVDVRRAVHVIEQPKPTERDGGTKSRPPRLSSTAGEVANQQIELALPLSPCSTSLNDHATYQRCPNIMGLQVQFSLDAY